VSCCEWAPETKNKLLAVMMSIHTRLGAENSLKVLDDNLAKWIWDLVCRGSKASSLLDKGDVHDDNEASASELNEDDGEK
jgi:hypothetical protein